MPVAKPIPWDAAVAAEIAHDLKDLNGALLPILHALNGRFGYIPDDALPLVADILNLTRADVHGVVSFYHDFRRQPAGRHVIKLCCAEACQSMGSDRLRADLEKALGIKLGETSADGRVTLEPVYCLGNCALSPAALIDGKLHGRLTESRTLALVGEGAR